MEGLIVEIGGVVAGAERLGLKWNFVDVCMDVEMVMGCVVVRVLRC